MLTLRRAEGREFDPRPGQYLTICQSCQRTLSSLTLGFKILVYLDEYSSVLAQMLNMFCVRKPTALVLSANQCARMFEKDVTCW